MSPLFVIMYPSNVPYTTAHHFLLEITSISCLSLSVSLASRKGNKHFESKRIICKIDQSRRAYYPRYIVSFYSDSKRKGNVTAVKS